MTTRREFLKVVGAGAAVSCAMLPLGCGTPGTNGPPLPAAGLKAADVPDGLSVLDSEPVILGKDADGLYAMTDVCTHAGCSVGVSGASLACPCHGSKFDANGAVTNGPAGSPLKHFLVTVDADGIVTVDTATEVDAATRVAV